LSIFTNYDAYVYARGALWDFRYFFSTNNLRLVKKISRRNYRQTQTLSHFTRTLVLFCLLYLSIVHFHKLWFICLCTRCSVGFQIFFLDKQSETCQKKFATMNSWLSCLNYKNQKWTILHQLSRNLCNYRLQIDIFRNLIYSSVFLEK